MKPNKNTEFNKFLEFQENNNNKRHKKLIEIRKEKCGNNIFKKWFYLGKKINSTRYQILRFYDEDCFSCEIKDIKNIFEAQKILKELEATNTTKNWFKISEYKLKAYSIEEYYSAPYDKFRWLSFKKWWKSIEKHGLIIRRPYMYYGKETYHIWNSNLEYSNRYKKFSKYWYKNKLEKIINYTKYNYKTCWYDYYDLFQSLIVKLTIKGLAIGLYGNAVIYKEQMHEIWECRKELIKAYNFEDYFQFNFLENLVKEKYNINYDIALYDKCEYLNKGKIIVNSNANAGINPLIVEKAFNTQDRNFVCEKCKEIDEFYLQNINYEEQAKQQKNVCKKAFELLAEGIYGWWD